MSLSSPSLCLLLFPLLFSPLVFLSPHAAYRTLYVTCVMAGYWATEVPIRVRVRARVRVRVSTIALPCVSSLWDSLAA